MNKLIVLLGLTMLSIMAKSQSITATPNPFVQRTLLNYTLTVADTISLQIFDVTGKQIINVKSNIYLSAGSYRDSILMDTFSPGVYLAYLKTKAQKPVAARLVKTGVTGIQAIVSPVQTKVFPNPTTGKLNIDVETSFIGSQITLYNSLGQIVYVGKATSSRSIIDLSPYAHGIYALFVGSTTGYETYKVIKE